MKKKLKNTKCILIAIALIVSQLTPGSLKAQNLKAWKQQPLPGFSDGPSESTKIILGVTGAVCLIIIAVLIVKKVNKNKTKALNTSFLQHDTYNMTLNSSLSRFEEIQNNIQFENNQLTNRISLNKTNIFNKNVSLGFGKRNFSFQKDENSLLISKIKCKRDFFFCIPKSNIENISNYKIANRN
jgi:hypothetical protein